MNSLTTIPEITGPQWLVDFAAVQSGQLFRNVENWENQMISDLSRLTQSHALQAPTAQDLAFTASELRNAVIAEFPNLRAAELSHALRIAGTGSYGKPFGAISVAFCCEAIRKYLEDDRRTQARKALIEASQKSAVKPKPSRDQIMQTVLDGLISEYLAAYPLDFGNSTYDYLDAMGLITATPERKTELIEHYRKVEEKRLVLEIAGAPRDLRREIQNELQTIQNEEKPFAAIKKAKTHCAKEALDSLRESFESDTEGLRAFLFDKLDAVVPQQA